MMNLPSSLNAIFWDLDFETLCTERDRDIIISRIAEYGTDEAVSWLWSRYSQAEIAQAIESRFHLLCRQTLNLWRLWLKKPENRQRVAEGLYAGIESYLQSTNSLALNLTPPAAE